jgi:hypothetical protein
MVVMHAQVQDMIQRRLDGELLEKRELDLVAEHLSTCASCRSFEHDIQRVVGVVESLPLEPAPRSFVAQVMYSVRLAQLDVAPGWLVGLGRVWAPMAGLLGVLILVYHAVAAQGVSLLNLPNAVAEWAALIDLNNLSSLLDATSLFAWSIGAGLLIGISLLTIAVFAIMAQVIGKPPALSGPTRRHTG